MSLLLRFFLSSLLSMTLEKLFAALARAQSWCV